MTKILSVLIAALVLSFGNAVSADSILQTDTVSTFSAGDLFDGDSGTFDLFDDQFFSFTANPFDSSLGTLVSATVSFTDLSVSGLGTALGQNSTTSIFISGQYTVEAANTVAGGAVFNGAGGDDFQISSAAGEILEFNLALPDLTQTFFVADAGLPFGDPNLVGDPFNPAILDAFTGSTPFDLRFNSPGQITLNNVSDVEAEASGTISVLFNFEAVSVPEPSSAVVGIFCLMVMSVRKRRV